MVEIEYDNSRSVVLIQSANSDDYLIKCCMAYEALIWCFTEEVYTLALKKGTTIYG
jgi:hypothetical protein